MVVRAEERTYVDLLRTFKKKVDIGKTDVNVKNLRRLGKDDLIITVEGGEGKTALLKKKK